MKYKVKEVNPQPMIVCIMICLFFILFSSVIAYSILQNYTTLDDLIVNHGLELFPVAVFGIIGISLLLFAFFPPKRIKGFLKEIKEEDGKKIYSFEEHEITSNGEKEVGFTHRLIINDIDGLKEGNYYDIYVKEFNHEVKYIDPNSNSDFKLAKSTTETGIKITLMIAMLFFVLLLSLCILGIIKFTKFIYVYIPLGIIAVIALIKLKGMFDNI